MKETKTTPVKKVVAKKKLAAEKPVAKKSAAKKPKSSTIIAFVLDKSGSMSSVQQATIEGFNEYIETLAKDGNKYEFTMTLFDTTYETSAVMDIKDVKKLDTQSFRPDGWTALYDAVCGTMMKIIPKKNQKVIFIIMTDGAENSSKEYTQETMRYMITSREFTGQWQFVYLGANQDSYATAQSYGIKYGNTTNFNASDLGIKTTMRSVSANTMCMSTQDWNDAVGSTGTFFSAEDQENLGNTK